VSFADVVQATADFGLAVTQVGGVWKVDAVVQGLPNLKFGAATAAMLAAIGLAATPILLAIPFIGPFLALASCWSPSTSPLRGQTMIDSFDSRALRYVDCYGQRFMRPGEFRYNVLAVGSHLAVTERPFRTAVSDRGGDQMTQHSVSLSIRDRDFVPDQPDLAIALGDMVMWNCPLPAARPFAVVGDQELFGSTNLVNESGTATSSRPTATTTGSTPTGARSAGWSGCATRRSGPRTTSSGGASRSASAPSS
jgi:hypothetical protein